MSDISASTTAARESARQGDGRFGAQENAEAATIDLAEADAHVAEPQECFLCEKESTIDQNGWCAVCSEHEAGAHDDNEFRMQNYCSLCSELVEAMVEAFGDAAEG